jgi:hypothetical protein
LSPQVNFPPPSLEIPHGELDKSDPMHKSNSMAKSVFPLPPSLPPSLPFY